MFYILNRYTKSHFDILSKDENKSQLFSNTGEPRYMQKNSKNRLAYNEFAYKKTKDDCQFEDRFQKKGHFWITFMQIRG